MVAALVAAAVGVLAGLLAAGLAAGLPPLVSGALGRGGLHRWSYAVIWFHGVHWLARRTG